MHPETLTQVDVATPGGRYPILIGSGLLGSPSTWHGLSRRSQAVVVTNEVVAPLYAPTLRAALHAQGITSSLLVLPDGEAHKDWTTLQQIFDHLLQQGCDRHSLLFALGGGVIGDMTGFAAACFMRGIDYVQVPTTLLSQVDSSVGGKTAINHAMGKNMIGAFHQPLRVVCDLDTLTTLPARELKAGLAEVIKYGPIADAEFLSWIEREIDALLGRDVVSLQHAIRRSCEIKAAVVGADERESGLRAILNFGHTFGHAIEAGLGYGQWLHGEAVACGMVMATALSAELGCVPASAVERIERLLLRAGLPVRGPALGPDRYLELMRVDKKAVAGEIRFVVLEDVGRATLRPASDAAVRAVLARHAHPA